MIPNMWQPSPHEGNTIDVLKYDKMRWEHGSYETELIKPILGFLRKCGRPLPHRDCGGGGVIQRTGGWEMRSVSSATPSFVTRTDIADAMRKLEALERDYGTENSHVSSHGNT